jgi:hypothetical protein
VALTKSFKDLVQSRVARDPDFAAALLREVRRTKCSRSPRKQGASGEAKGALRRPLDPLGSDKCRT